MLGNTGCRWTYRWRRTVSSCMSTSLTSSACRRAGACRPRTRSTCTRRSWRWLRQTRHLDVSGRTRSALTSTSTSNACSIYSSPPQGMSWWRHSLSVELAINRSRVRLHVGAGSGGGRSDTVMGSPADASYRFYLREASIRKPNNHRKDMSR